MENENDGAIVNLSTLRSLKDSITFSLSNFITKSSKPFESQYTIDSYIAGGSFGEVSKVICHNTGLFRAVKMISKSNIGSESQRAAFLSEINILKTLDHPHILKIYEYYEDDDSYYIVMDFYEGGELFQKIIDLGTFSEREAANVISQIVSAVAYAHKNGIVHRDLKPENILISSVEGERNFNVKVVDWGASTKYSNIERLKELHGSLYYIAPEVLNKSYTEKCDIWSIGIIMYIMLSGEPPFNGKNNDEIFKKIQSASLKFPEESFLRVSEQAKSLIKDMLNRNIKKRISAMESLSHPWFKIWKNVKASENNVEFKANLLRLRKFRSSQKLKQAILAFIVSQSSSENENSSILETFKALDSDGDGILSKEDINQGFKKFTDEKTAKQEAERVFEILDFDKNGQINYTEFLAAAFDKRKLLNNEKIQHAFKAFDKDGNGRITPSDLKEIIGGELPDDNLEIWEELIKEADQNGDGEVSFESFAGFMMKFSESTNTFRKI